MNRIVLILFACVAALTAAYAESVYPEPRKDTKKPLWGYVDPKTEKWVVKPQYTEAGTFSTGADGKVRALVGKGNLKGYLGTDGKPLGAGIVFESMEPMMSGDNLIVSVKGKKGIVAPDGSYLIKPEMTALTPLGAEGYVITVKGKKGIISPDGKIIVEPLYTDIDTSDPDVFIIGKGGKKGLLSRKGEMLLPPSRFEDVMRINTFWKVKKGDKTGLFDPSKRIVAVNPKYKDVMEPFTLPSGTFYPVMNKKDKWGALNSSGKEVLKCKNREFTPMPWIDAISVIRDRMGSRLYFPQNNVYLEVSSWSKEKLGPFTVYQGKIDAPSPDIPARWEAGVSFGESFDYTYTFENRESFYKSLKEKSFHFVTDGKGESLGDKVTIKPLGKNWLMINESSPWMVYDPEGNIIKETGIKGECETYSDAEGWYAAKNKVIFPDLNVYRFVYCGTNLSFIDKDGNDNWIPLKNDVPCFNRKPYDEVEVLDESSAIVKRNGKCGFYSDNTEVLSPDYTTIAKITRRPYLEARQGEYVGLYDLAKKVWIIPLSNKVMKYEFYNSYRDNSPILIYNGKWGLMDSVGHMTMPMSYDKNKVLNSLDPNSSQSSTRSKTKPKQKQKTSEKPKKKGTTEFQESKEKRRF